MHAAQYALIAAAALAAFLATRGHYLEEGRRWQVYVFKPLLWLPYFVAGGIVVVLVRPGLKPALRGPVAAYVVVIAVMAGQATERWYVLGGGVALAAAIGAGLFVVSDAVLAIDRFRRHFRAARAVTLATYWAAQLLIALSVSGA